MPSRAGPAWPGLASVVDFPIRSAAQRQTLASRGSSFRLKRRFSSPKRATGPMPSPCHPGSMPFCSSAGWGSHVLSSRREKKRERERDRKRHREEGRERDGEKERVSKRERESLSQSSEGRRRGPAGPFLTLIDCPGWVLHIFPPKSQRALRIPGTKPQCQQQL